jgi:hypothetical protein
MVQADNRCVCCILLSGYFLTPSFYLFNFHCQGSCLAFTFASILMQVHFCHFQQETTEASDNAAKKYYEETLKEDRSNFGVTAVMRAAAKSKQQSFKGQFSKYLVIANPKFDDKFLQEVSASNLIPWQYILV